MHSIKLFIILAILLPGVLFFSCHSVSPIQPKTLNSPTLLPIEITVVKSGTEYTESVHLRWTPPHSDSLSVAYYNLIRLFPEDSSFDATFPSSQGIPPDINYFYDPIPQELFQSVFENYLTLVYRIYAVDNLGRSSDTSVSGVLLLTKQPTLKKVDFSSGCFSWFSPVNISGPFSYCRVWNDSSGVSWTSDTYNMFPPTDMPAEFNACIPDSLIPVFHGRWFYAFFVEIVESKSLKIGYVDVP